MAQNSARSLLFATVCLSLAHCQGYANTPRYSQKVLSRSSGEAELINGPSKDHQEMRGPNWDQGVTHKLGMRPGEIIGLHQEGKGFSGVQRVTRRPGTQHVSRRSRRRRNVISPLIYVGRILSNLADSGLTFAAVVTKGCSFYPDICTHRDAISRLEEDNANLASIYNREVHDLHRLILYSRDCQYNSEYIEFYIDGFFNVGQQLQDIYADVLDKLMADFEIIEFMNDTYVSFKKLDPLEASLKDVDEMIDEQKNEQMRKFAIGLFTKVVVHKFFNIAHNAYKRVVKREGLDASIEDLKPVNRIPGNTKRTFMRSKLHKMKKVFKRMLLKPTKEMFYTHPKELIKKRIVKKWEHVNSLNSARRNPVTARLNSLKSKLKSKLKSPLRTIHAFRMTKLQKGVVSLGIIANVMIQAAAVLRWGTVRDEIQKMRELHENYNQELIGQIYLIRESHLNVTELIRENMDIFKISVNNFTDLVKNVTEYDEFANNTKHSVQLPMNISAPLFSTNFSEITTTNLKEKQIVVRNFILEAKLNLTTLKQQLEARHILYGFVEKATNGSESIQEIYDGVSELYKYQLAEPVKSYGRQLNMSDVVCVVAIEHGMAGWYDYYDLSVWRPLCDVTEDDYEHEKVKAQLSRCRGVLDDAINTTVPSQSVTVQSLERLLDIAKNTHSQSPDEAMKLCGENLSESDVICAIATNFPFQATYAFFDLDVMRASCGNLTQAEYDVMSARAGDARDVYDDVSADLRFCLRRGMGSRRCECIDDQAEFYDISRDIVKHYMKIADPSLTEYCGNKMYCACENL